MKREVREPSACNRRGRFAGVASLTRAFGGSGESVRPSCSAVQHSLDAIAQMESAVREGAGKLDED